MHYLMAVMIVGALALTGAPASAARSTSHASGTIYLAKSSKKSSGSTRVERSAGTGRYVKSGTEKRKPRETVTEPRRPRKK